MFDISTKSFLNRKILPKIQVTQNPQYLLNSKQEIWTNLSSEGSFVTGGQRCLPAGFRLCLPVSGRVFSTLEWCVCSDYQPHALGIKIQ